MVMLSGKSAPSTAQPMPKASVQGAFRQAKLAAGIDKRGVSVHTLRHSYATHLLEAGVNIRVIQQYLGHAQLESTMWSTSTSPIRARRTPMPASTP
jgi:site-specific recombinase XerD